MGRPHDLGNISAYLGRKVGLEDYIGWLTANMDPAIGWSDIEWVRDFWKGPMIIKGILDREDARDAVRFNADGIVVSNHGGRQLDGALSTARALPRIVEAVGDELTGLCRFGRALRPRCAAHACARRKRRPAGPRRRLRPGGGGAGRAWRMRSGFLRMKCAFA